MNTSTPVQQPQQRFFETRRGRILRENLTAYLFLAPAAIIVFTFGIFPVIFSLFVSLYRWRRTPVGYRGLDNYDRVLGELGFVSFFGIALGALALGLFSLWRLWQQTKQEGETSREWLGLTAIFPGIALTTATYYFANWFFTVFPIIITVPERLRGQEITRDLFINEFFNSFTFVRVMDTLFAMRLSMFVAVGLALAWPYLMQSMRGGKYINLAWLSTLGILVGGWLLNLTIDEINIAIDEAQAAETDLPIWTYTIMILGGTLLLGSAWWLWSYSVHHHAQSNLTWILRMLAVCAALVGAVFLILELPPAIENTEEDVLRGFRVTAFYSLFSVPVQLALGLFLAVLLFQNIKGKSFFRVMFFMPYITPFVATSVVFTLVFSHGESSPANQIFDFFGIPTQNWIREPKGIFFLLFGEDIPEWAHGPSLALFVIILYNVWIYAGYSTVIFLAGLGSISEDVYDAAKIDGANAWQQFRHITLPLLSPTTFFLILIATIGTFQAFTQIFLMRQPGTYNTVDTINLYIFNEIRSSNPNYGYGSAMAFVLFGVILFLTLILNRVAGRRVFYG